MGGNNSYTFLYKIDRMAKIMFALPIFLVIIAHSFCQNSGYNGGNGGWNSGSNGVNSGGNSGWNGGSMVQAIMIMEDGIVDQTEEIVVATVGGMVDQMPQAIMIMGDGTVDQITEIVDGMAAQIMETT